MQEETHSELYALNNELQEGGNMPRRKFYIWIVCALCIGSLCSCQTEKKTETGYTITEPYVYEVKSPEETDPSLSSAEQYKVPEELLKKMTTQALVETACNHPYFFLLVSADSSFDSVLAKSFVRAYDVAKELKSRADKEIYLTPILEEIQTGRSRWDGSFMPELCEYVLDNS